MSKKHKVWMVALWGLLVVAMVGLVATRATRSQPPAPLFAAPSFSLVDQNGAAFGSDDLRGKVWIADFIFTHCAGPCPLMTARMADVQQGLGSPDVKLVSFSVDPARDTPGVLKEYADRVGADASRWKFLTGTSEQIAAVAKGMNVTAMSNPDGSDQVIHSTLFMLVDRRGQVVRLYHVENDEEMKRLAADADDLAAATAASVSENK